MAETKGVKQVLNVSNRVRFCWWGGEESGLLGSRAYVAMLNRTGQLYRVALNLNFDMLGSPNFKTGVYNGTDADKQDADAVYGSSYIMKLFTNFFSALSPAQPWTPSAFTGRSDYGPFLEMGIPAGGLDTGAEGIKSMGDRKVFGGLAKTAFDPCYHQECDDILNVNLGEIGLLSRAVAHTLERLVTDDEMRYTLKYPLQRSVSSRRHIRSFQHPAAFSDPLVKGVALPYAGPHALF